MKKSKSNTSKQKTLTNNLKTKKRKDGLFLITSLLGLLIVLKLVTAILFFTAMNTDEQFKFFGINENNDFTRLVSFDQPNHKDTVVSNWVSKALVSTFDFNYVNMSSHLEEESKYWFTEAGRAALMDSIKRNSSYFSDVVSKEAVVQLTLKQSPILVRAELNNRTKIYGWIYQVPAQFTYITTDNEPEVVDILFTLAVERRSYEDSPLGLGISKLRISK